MSPFIEIFSERDQGLNLCYYGTFPLVIDMRATYAKKKNLDQEILKYILAVSRRFTWPAEACAEAWRR